MSPSTISFNNPNPGLPTDRWLVQCHSTSTSAATDPACWGNEVRRTDSSFNMEAVVPMLSGDFFLGDYFGLATAGDDFVATFTQPDNQNVTSIFARRVGSAYAADPALNGIGNDPTAKLCLPDGAHCSKDGLDPNCCSGAYETEHYPMDPADPVEAVKFRMEQQGLSRKDLEPLIGTRTRVAEVLNRKRSLSIGMIRRLHDRLGISAEVLIRPSRKEQAA